MTSPTGLSGLSYTDLQGRTVLGSDGSKIGKIADLYDDESGGAPVFATVHTGLFGSKTTFVPMTQASLQNDDIVVPYTKDVVKGAPSIAADADISPQEEQEIFSYYGLGGGSGSAGASDRDRDGIPDSQEGSGTAGYAAGTAGSATDRDRDGIPDSHEGSGTAGTAGSATDRDGDGIPDSQERASAAAGNQHGTVGHDTSGPTTDQAMTRSEEQLRVGTQQVEAGRARLRKYVVSENVTQTVPVSHEEVRIEREPITEANMPAAHDGPAISEEEHEVVLHAEQPVVQKEAVPVERIRMDTETVTEQQQVTEQVQKEQIDTDGDAQSGVNRNS